MWKVYAILSAVFAATTAILAKVGIKGINSNLATAIRTIVVLLVAWGIVVVQGRWSDFKTLNKQNLLFLGLSGIATGLSWIFYFKALQEGEVSKVVPIDKLSIALTIIFSILFLGEHPEPKVLIGGGLIIVGVLIMVL